MLRALLFDAGDVIYHRPRRGVALRGFLADLGLTPPERKDPRLKAMVIEAHAGRISREAYFLERLRLSGVTNAADLARGVEVQVQAQADIELFEGVTPTLLALQHRGVKLGIVTNTFDDTATKRAWFAPYGIDTIWDSWASSCELGVLKPEPAIYLAALEPLGLPAAEVGFVAHSSRELVGAKAVGCYTIAYNPDEANPPAECLAAQFAELLEVVL